MRHLLLWHSPLLPTRLSPEEVMFGNQVILSVDATASSEFEFLITKGLKTQNFGQWHFQNLMKPEIPFC